MEMLIENELDIKSIQVKNGSMVLRSINHELRQQILKLIHKKGSMNVTEIFQELKLEQSVASQHLAILRFERMVNVSRKGKFVSYSVNYERLREVEELASKLSKQ